MSERRVEFHKLEDYGNKEMAKDRQYVLCSFETERFGYFQIKYKSLDREHWKLKELTDEPNIHNFSKEQQLKIERCCAIAWRLVWDAPAATDRFEGPKSLYTCTP